MTDLKPGLELDAIIAEKVMGLKPCSDPLGKCEQAHTTPVTCWGDGSGFGGGSELKPYSTDIAAAWLVVEKLKMYEPEISWSDEQHCWTVHLWKAKDGGMPTQASETLPHAICLAALAAVGGGE